MPPPSQRPSNAPTAAKSLKTAMTVKNAVKTFASTAASAKSNSSQNPVGQQGNHTGATFGSTSRVGPKKEAVAAKKVEEKMPIEKPPAPAAAYDMPRDIVEEMPRLPSSTTSIMSLTKDAPGPRTSAGHIGRPVHRSDYLKLTLEELVAEPDQYRTVPQVWSVSTKVFTLTKDITYKTLTALCALPVALLAGLVFAVVSCLHIWLLHPCLRQFRINMFAVRQCVRIVLDSVVAPCISELGLIFSRMRIEHKNFQEVHRI